MQPLFLSASNCFCKKNRRVASRLTAPSKATNQANLEHVFELRRRLRGFRTCADDWVHCNFIGLQPQRSHPKLRTGKSMTLATHRSFRADDRGAMAPLMAVLFTLLAGFGALAIDVAHGYRIKAQLSSAADAGSLAGAQQLPDTTAARTKGVALAAANAPSNFGTVTQAADVVVGYYDRSADTFTAGGSPTNAVKVTSARTAARGNAPPKFLIGALGLNALDVQASAVAYRPKNSPPYCVYVLNTGNSNASLSVTGGGEFAVPNCGVYVNSAHPNGAAQATGASKVRASRFCV